MSLIEQISEALSKVQDPELRHPITDLGMVEDLQEKSGVVSLTLLLTISACPMQDRLRTDVTSAITAVNGVTSVDLTFGVMTEEQRNNVKKIVRGGREKFIPFAHPDSLSRVI
jgi:ATP-binding protein involved in chromosome partitioning